LLTSYLTGLITNGGAKAHRMGEYHYFSPRV